MNFDFSYKKMPQRSLIFVRKNKPKPFAPAGQYINDECNNSTMSLRRSLCKFVTAHDLNMQLTNNQLFKKVVIGSHEVADSLKPVRV